MSQFLVYKPIIEPYGTIFPFELSFDKFNNYISQYHRIKSWKGTTKSNLPTKAGSATAGYPGLYLVGFSIFAQMETPQPLGNVWSCLQYSYSDGISYSLICIHCLFSCQWKGERSEKDLAPSSSLPPIRYLYLDEIPLSLLCSWLNSSSSLFLHQKYAPIFSSFSQPLDGLTRINSHLSCTEKSRTQWSTADVASTMLVSL